MSAFAHTFGAVEHISGVSALGVGAASEFWICVGADSFIAREISNPASEPVPQYLKVAEVGGGNVQVGGR